MAAGMAPVHAEGFSVRGPETFGVGRAPIFWCFDFIKVARERAATLMMTMIRAGLRPRAGRPGQAANAAKLRAAVPPIFGHLHQGPFTQAHIWGGCV